jgi:hypothetical protein
MGFCESARHGYDAPKRNVFFTFLRGHHLGTYGLPKIHSKFMTAMPAGHIESIWLDLIGKPAKLAGCAIGGMASNFVIVPAGPREPFCANSKGEREKGMEFPRLRG